MMDTQQPPLPDYDRPPVIEVVCGTQFEPLTAFQATAFGVFWEKVRAEYPTTEEKPPLDPLFERLGEPGQTEARVEISPTPPLPRMFFVHQQPNYLMQVQKDRFLHNWRKVGDADVYPHYPAIFDKFWAGWGRFLTFCHDEHIGDVRVNQLEITYINHILAGDAWQGPGNVGDVFPDAKWRQKRTFLPTPEVIGWRASFQLPDQRGRLHVALKQGMRRTDGKPVLLCDLTARGMAASQDAVAIQQWFSTAREWIVRGFADLADERVQKEVWLRKA